MILKDFIYEEKDANRFSKIRMMARKITKNREQKCSKCNYNKHVETCHIKSISSFLLETPISVINSEENLILLCPNCHWEKDNLYKIEEQNKRKICVCGNKKWKYSLKCRKCANKEIGIIKRKVKNRPSKEELENLISTIPYTKIGELYGVSDNAIKKWCQTYNIKLPNRLGYWARLRYKNGWPTGLG